MDIIIATSSTDLRIALEIMIREEPGMSIVGTTSESDGLCALIETYCPDLVLLDTELAGSSYTQVLTKLHSSKTPLKIVVLGKYLHTRETALQAGADEYVVIGDPPENLMRTFHRLNVPSV